MPMPEEVSLGGTQARRTCAFCGHRADPDDPDNFREVVSWVHGRKLDGPVLREQTGRVAHAECVEKVRAGQSPDQEKLL